MAEFTYDFDSIEIQIDGVTVSATGTLDVGYTSSRPERSTGWRGGVEIDSYGELEVTITQEDGSESGPFYYRKGHPVFDAIIAACDTDIEDAAKYDCRWD